MEYTKSEWLLACKIAASYDSSLILVGSENESPTFQYGLWNGAFEHGRKFRSVVLRHRNEEGVRLQKGWVACPPSDKKKNWAFRVTKCAPEEIKTLLEQLKAAE